MLVGTGDSVRRLHVGLHERPELVHGLLGAWPCVPEREGLTYGLPVVVQHVSTQIIGSADHRAFGLATDKVQIVPRDREDSAVLPKDVYLSRLSVESHGVVSPAP